MCRMMKIYIGTYEKCCDAERGDIEVCGHLYEELHLDVRYRLIHSIYILIT